MYERGKEVNLEASVGVMVKNLQVVSFDSEWLEIYLGTVCKTTITNFQIIMKFYISIKIGFNYKFHHHYYKG